AGESGTTIEVSSIRTASRIMSIARSIQSATGHSGLQADALPPASPLRAAIRHAYRRNERDAVAALLAQVPPAARHLPQAQALARQLVQTVREKRVRASGVDALMHAFSLSSEEGVA